jgi:DNA-binding beta-propeller fold protein YncE
VLRVAGLGTTAHAADLIDDDQARFEATLLAAREPDGIALTPGGRFLVTADEGDTDPKAGKTKPGLPAGGGRTLSVFDAETGAFIADTGDGIDRMAAARGTYPDARSPNKGSEPEMVTTFVWRGGSYAAVSLERANAVALVDLSSPQQPTVVTVAPIDRSEKAGKVAPEGIAHFAAGERLFIYTANEKKGTVTALELRER